MPALVLLSSSTAVICRPPAAATAALKESVENGLPIGAVTSAERPPAETLVVTGPPSARSMPAVTLAIAARNAGSPTRSVSLCR